MATLKDEAKKYLPKTMKNISDLPEVSIEAEIYVGEGTDDEGKPYTYKYIDVNGEMYRVPFIVIGMIKDIVDNNTNIKRIKVKKTGEGLKTRYSVIPLQ